MGSGRVPGAPNVSDLVDVLDLSAFHAPYEGDGRRNSPYDPRMDGEGAGLRGTRRARFGRGSWRRGWRRTSRSGCWRRATFRGTGTLYEFRRRHLDDFGAVLAEAVRLARGRGLAGSGRVSVDGTIGPGQREQAQGDELRPNAQGGAVVCELRSRGCWRRRKRSTQRRMPTTGRTFGATNCLEELKRREDRLAAIEAAEGAPGGRAASGGRRARPQAGAEAQPEGRPPLQTGVRRAGGEGAE